MKKILLFLLVLSCLCLCGCDIFSSSTSQTKETTEPVTEEAEKETEETTEEETPIGHTPDQPIAIGEYVTIPASKADLQMKVLEVVGHADDIVIKMNLTVANLKNGARLSLYNADFELLCNNGQIIEEDYAYSEYEIERKYNLNIPYVYDVTMGGDGSVDFYVYFHGDSENAKMLTISYGRNKYIYFSLK
ncbi:MAG: hypothetical protein HFE66_08385 [Clostridiales bacterium]|jgi:hypothetical protein|nr:hypothetical protein [Clostridiales bacterium]